MKKLLFLSFFGLFLLACTTDEGDGAPFVTDVVMPPSSQLFAPGDEVTVAARGFEADDDIMLRIAWPLSQAALPEGYADGVWAVVTERTESDITFLAPGGYPASTTEVKLFRRGKAMTLGKISVSDGRPPEEPSLYGITQYDCDETGIDRIDLTTGDLTRIETLGVLRRMHCVVNTPGSNRIYGLAPDGNIGAAAFYDLTMRYFRDSGYDNVAVAGTLGNSAAFLRCEDGRLVLMELNMTRTNVAPVPPSWMLPSDIAPEMLGENPFVTVYGGYLLLAAHTAPDSYTPLVLTGRSGEGYAVKTVMPNRPMRWCRSECWTKGRTARPITPSAAMPCRRTVWPNCVCIIPCRWSSTGRWRRCRPPSARSPFVMTAGRPRSCSCSATPATAATGSGSTTWSPARSGSWTEPSPAPKSYWPDNPSGTG